MTYTDLNIIYEDNHVLVVVKPQNVPSQADESRDKDMLTLVKDYVKYTYAKPGNAFVGLVHRLDRPTGGIMVFAKTSKAAARLAEGMAAGTFEKSYLAVTVGTPREKSGEIVSFLKKNPMTNTVYLASETTDDAKRAVLTYKVVESREKIALVKIDLQTGRSHQIRVQLQSIGCPVFGDVKYGGNTLAKGYNLNLWAYSLRFSHPTRGETMSFFVLPPDDEEAWKRFNMNAVLPFTVGKNPK